MKVSRFLLKCKYRGNIIFKFLRGWLGGSGYNVAYLLPASPEERLLREKKDLKKIFSFLLIWKLKICDLYLQPVSEMAGGQKQKLAFFRPITLDIWHRLDIFEAP
jgi:hypothetical protein